MNRNRLFLDPVQVLFPCVIALLAGVLIAVALRQQDMPAARPAKVRAAVDGWVLCCASGPIAVWTPFGDCLTPDVDGRCRVATTQAAHAAALPSIRTFVFCLSGPAEPHTSFCGAWCFDVDGDDDVDLADYAVLQVAPPLATTYEWRTKQR